MKEIGLHNRMAQARDRARGEGFSLMEVLFSVVVLTMGLVFVAAQFPIGLMNSRNITDATMDIVDAHNAQVMLELQLREYGNPITRPSNFLRSLDDSPSPYFNTVHFLSRPNRRIGSGDFVMDDPLNMYFPSIPPINPPYSYTDPTQALPRYIRKAGDIASAGVLMPGNLGMMVSPAVDETDREVEKRLRNLFGLQIDPCCFRTIYTPDQIDTAIFQVALQRDYNWCALYQPLLQSYQFFIFTMRPSKKTGARYAMQNTSSLTNPQPLPAGQDRALPVPWIVALEQPVTNAPLNRFVLNAFTNYPEAIGEILRSGSVLVDARLGYVYVVVEITLNSGTGNWVVQLDRPLNAINDVERLLSLLTFWVVPPAFDRRAGRFDDVQPVVRVTQQVMQF